MHGAGGDGVSEEAIVRHCAPTLAGLKTGNMFTTLFADAVALRDSLWYWNSRLSKKGICVLPLRCDGCRVLIYFFRPKRLREDLQDRVARTLLDECGYADKTPSQCIRHLMKRLREDANFPHEVGLFLGYPPLDVKGFIENRARNFKCVGHWKVYDDEQAARRQFALYDKCTRIYCERWTRGMNIERLAVPGDREYRGSVIEHA